jgi:hypothetical protein
MGERHELSYRSTVYHHLALFPRAPVAAGSHRTATHCAPASRQRKERIMRLRDAHPACRPYDRELLERLDDTVEALAQARIRLREAGNDLIRANRDNARQR